MTANASPAQPAARSFDPNWSEILSELKLQLDSRTFEAHLARSRLAAIDASARAMTVALSNDHSVEWVENRLGTVIERVVVSFVGDPVDVSFVVAGNGQLQEVLDPSASADGAGGSSDSGGSTARYGRNTFRVAPGEEAARARIITAALNPNEWYLITPHYSIRFWRPLLGLIPFALWEILRCYEYFWAKGYEEPPTIETISDTLGHGNRYTILGRAASGSRKEQKGAIEALKQHNIAVHWIEGEDRSQTHVFYVLNELPVLTPKQVAKLSDRKQAEHESYLKRLKKFDIDAWKRIDLETNIPPRWWE